MNTEFQNLTHPQIKRRAQAKAKAWLKTRGYNDVQITCTHGTFHVTNANNKWLTAKDILEQSTGLKFNYMSDSMARLDPSEYQ